MENIKRATKRAVVCYAFGDLASQFVWAFVGSYLTIYYTDILGLTPLAVSTIMIIARVWDAINDPMMGAIAERTKSRWGRFRPYIAFGSPFLALFSVLTFTNPFGGEADMVKVLWAGFTYIGAGMLYTLTNIPYGALAAVMTEDSNQRNQINASRNIGMNIGMLIVNALSPVLLLAFSGRGAEVADAGGYLGTVILYAIISIPLFLAVFATSKENVKPVVSAQEHKVTFKETVKNLVKNKYLMIVTLIIFLYMTALMGRMSVCTYWIIYCLGSFEMISLITTIPTVCSMIASFFVPALAKKFGKRNVLAISLAVQGAGLLIMYLAPYDNIPMIIVGDIIFGLFWVCMPLTLSMIADSVDYMEDKTGIRTDGTAYSVYSLGSKFGTAIGSSLGVVIMAAFGYIANAEQTVEAMRGINITVNLIPAILYFLASLVCLFWRMSDKDADDIRARLNVRQIKKENAEQ